MFSIGIGEFVFVGNTNNLMLAGGNLFLHTADVMVASHSPPVKYLFNYTVLSFAQGDCD